MVGGSKDGMHPDIPIRCMKRETVGPKTVGRPIGRGQREDWEVASAIWCIKYDPVRNSEDVFGKGLLAVTTE